MSGNLQKTILLDLTSREIAEVLVRADSDYQAEVLTHMAELLREWKHHHGFQLAYVSASEQLSDGGRELMQEIGEYAPRATK